MIWTDRWSEPPRVYPPARQKRRVGDRVLAVNAGARAPSGGVAQQGVVLTDLQSLLDCQ